jgi:hypothetical protein
MSRKKSIILLMLIALLTCACHSSKVLSKELPDNPTNYMYHIKIDSANKFLKKFILYCSTMKFGADEIRFNGDGYYSIWSNEAKSALKGEEYKYDVWMIVKVDSSDVYYNKNGKPLEYILECRAHFTSIDGNDTKLEIQVLNAKVHVRDALLPSAPHFVNDPIYKNVKPTTIEEYKILQCFGKGLGVIDKMPTLKLSAKSKYSIPGI